MARPRKTTQVKTEIPVDVTIEKPEEKIVETPKKVSEPILIPTDNSVVARRAPTMDSKYIANKLQSGCAYNIDKIVHSIIYGDFYLLTNGLYVSKVGNFIVRE